jgi:hypothetical protein
MIKTEETQMCINCNTGGNEGNKTGAATFTVITSAIGKINRYFWLITNKLFHIK